MFESITETMRRLGGEQKQNCPEIELVLLNRDRISVVEQEQEQEKPSPDPSGLDAQSSSH